MKKIYKIPLFALCIGIFIIIMSSNNALLVQAASLSTTALSPEREQIYDLFGQDKWEYADESTKQSICLRFIHDLSKELDVDVPILVFDKLNNNVRGMNFYYENKIVINTDLYGIGSEALSTCVHEMRHAWQNKQINTGTEYGKQLLNARNHYIEWNEDFTGYENNLLEKDAFDYATFVNSQFLTWSYNMQHPESTFLFQPAP